MEIKLRKCENCKGVIPFKDSNLSIPQYIRKKFCCPNCLEDFNVRKNEKNKKT